MSHHTSHLMSRRLALGSRSTIASAVPSRAFAISAQHSAERSPSLSDISPSGAAQFEHKQKEFRAHLANATHKSDSQSSFFASASSPAPASQVSPGEGNVEENAQGLGSLSTHTEEAKQKAEAGQQKDGNAGMAKGALSTLIYGTKEGREMDREIERSFSQMLARGKYVHSIVFHDVKPDKVDEYVELVGGWYPKVASNPENKVHLVGSWRTEVGDCDTFGQ